MPGRVMIFDDDTDLLEICTIILTSKHFTVKGCNRCTEIIRDVADFKPDVILMDNWIPDAGGIKSTQLLKSTESWKELPVILFSANNNVEELAREAGAEYFLQKPFEIEELESMVIRAVQNSTRSAAVL